MERLGVNGRQSRRMMRKLEGDGFQTNFQKQRKQKNTTEYTDVFPRSPVHAITSRKETAEEMENELGESNTLLGGRTDFAAEVK